jgi:hypothetical protein
MPPRISAICCLLLQSLWYKIPQGSERFLADVTVGVGSSFR